jgi:hypothetical protein
VNARRLELVLLGLYYVRRRQGIRQCDLDLGVITMSDRAFSASVLHCSRGCNIVLRVVDSVAELHETAPVTSCQTQRGIRQM